MNGIRELFCNERIILTAIVLNTIILFLGGFWPNSLLFDLSDAAFTLIFVCEAMAKISKYGWKNYWQSGWNKFDFIILLIALPSLAGPFIDIGLALDETVQVFQDAPLHSKHPEIAQRTETCCQGVTSCASSLHSDVGHLLHIVIHHLRQHRPGIFRQPCHQPL